jgi:hypothetical protein
MMPIRSVLIATTATGAFGNHNPNEGKSSVAITGSSAMLSSFGRKCASSSVDFVKFWRIFYRIGNSTGCFLPVAKQKVFDL